MAIGDLITAEIGKIVTGGSGLARVDGRVVFIPFSAPGDLVEARIVCEKHNRAEAEITAVREASPSRVAPRCPLYTRCGGCNFQHISFEEQLRIKRDILLETLQRLGRLERGEIPEPRTVSAEPWEYRSRFSFHSFPPARSPGFMARAAGAKGAAGGAPFEVVPIPDCPIAAPGIREALKNGELSAPPGRGRFTVLLAETELLVGGPPRKTRLAGTELYVSADCFFQSNAAMLEKLAALLRDMARRAGSGSPGIMADLYAGVGTFSVFLAPLFGGADLFEISGESLALARRSLNGKDCRFFAGRDRDWARQLARKKGNYAFAVSDPPRQGMSPAVTAALLENGPPLLAYVSCDPASLARDWKNLSGAYAARELYFLDFYPQTSHIESLTLFERKDSPARP